MNDRDDDTTRPDDEGEGSGLPAELEEMLRSLTGGAPLDPKLAEMMGGLGIDKIDPSMLQMLMGQVQAMFAGGNQDGSVNLDLATDIARKVAATRESDETDGGSAGGAGGLGGGRPLMGFRAPSADPTPGERDRAAAREAVEVASLWLDPVSDLPDPGLRGEAWSRAQWVEATMPVWRDLVDPVAAGVAEAVGEAMTKQLGELGASGLPEGLVPPGMNPAAMTGEMGGLMRRMHGSLYSVQLGQAVGALSAEVLTGCEPSLPLVPAPTLALMTEAIRESAAGLEVDEAQVRLHLAVREVARARLFAGAPWLGPQLLAAVRDYAAGIEIDTSAIEEQLRSVDPTNPEAVQEALAGRLFTPQHSAAQTAALTRLETLLALVEGWVDVVTAQAVGPHLPQADALGEAVRRRRASGGPVEKAFSTLVGLELRPRRLRDAANLFAALAAKGGAAARDAAWGHPDLAPQAADLDDPLGYVERSGAGASADLDAELDALLREERGDA